MDKVVSQDGTTIAFDRPGEVPALILVGGAFQYRAIDPRTAQLATLLAEHYTVYHYDRRGRGDSGDTPPYEIEREVEDIEALVNEVGGAIFARREKVSACLATAPVPQLCMFMSSEFLLYLQFCTLKHIYREVS